MYVTYLLSIVGSVRSMSVEFAEALTSVGASTVSKNLSTDCVSILSAIFFVGNDVIVWLLLSAQKNVPVDVTAGVARHSMFLVVPLVLSNRFGLPNSSNVFQSFVPSILNS